MNSSPALLMNFLRQPIQLGLDHGEKILESGLVDADAAFLHAHQHLGQGQLKVLHESEQLRTGKPRTQQAAYGKHCLSVIFPVHVDLVAQPVANPLQGVIALFRAQKICGKLYVEDFGAYRERSRRPLFEHALVGSHEHMRPGQRTAQIPKPRPCTGALRRPCPESTFRPRRKGPRPCRPWAQDSEPDAGSTRAGPGFFIPVRDRISLDGRFRLDADRIGPPVLAGPGSEIQDKRERNSYSLKKSSAPPSTSPTARSSRPYSMHMSVRRVVSSRYTKTCSMCGASRVCSLAVSRSKFFLSASRLGKAAQKAHGRLRSHTFGMPGMLSAASPGHGLKIRPLIRLEARLLHKSFAGDELLPYPGPVVPHDHVIIQALPQILIRADNDHAAVFLETGGQGGDAVVGPLRLRLQARECPKA